MPDFIQITTTTDSEAAAQEIAAHLVEQRLAACVQVLGPIRSTYRWEGKVETSAEWLCVIKSRAALYSEIEQAIRERHSYDVPEIIAIPILAGSDSYLTWLAEQVTIPSTSTDAI